MNRKPRNQEEYVSLAEELIEHDKLYFDEARPILSDYEYDQMMAALLAYEKEHPGQILPNSPSRRLSEGPTEGFKQRAHLAPMMSLNNTYSETEVADFVKRVHKLLEKKEVAFLLRIEDGWDLHFAPL